MKSTHNRRMGLPRRNTTTALKSTFAAAVEDLLIVVVIMAEGQSEPLWGAGGLIRSIPSTRADPLLLIL